METKRNERAIAVHAALDRIRHKVSTNDVTRRTLGSVLVELQQLAARAELWGEKDFPCTDSVAKQSRYLIWEDPNHTLALYMIVWEPGKSIPPHNHTTWACIAGISGQEENRLYERLDDGAQLQRSVLKLDRIIEVRKGTGIAMLPDDIHAVTIVGNQSARTLHLYGRALETLNERLSFDLEAGTYEVKSIGVTSIRALV